MPNWCSTTINFYSKNHNLIRNFHSKIETVLTNPTPFPGAWNDDSGWLGNFLLMAGFDRTDIYDSKLPFKYRGSVLSVSDISSINDYYFFCIDTETAWCPKIIMWEEILKKLDPDNDIKLSYIAEEPGMGEYLKYDPDNLFYAEDDYFIDAYAEESEEIVKAFPYIKENDFESSTAPGHYINEMLKRLLQTEEIDTDNCLDLLDDFNERLNEIDENAYIHIHKYQICKNEES